MDMREHHRAYRYTCLNQSRICSPLGSIDGRLLELLVDGRCRGVPLHQQQDGGKNLKSESEIHFSNWKWIRLVPVSTNRRRMGNIISSFFASCCATFFPAKIMMMVMRHLNCIFVILINPSYGLGLPVRPSFSHLEVGRLMRLLQFS